MLPTEIERLIRSFLMPKRCDGHYALCLHCIKEAYMEDCNNRFGLSDELAGRDVDYLIPANDDASKSINIIMSEVTDAIAEGLADRKSEKQADKEGNDEPKKVKKVIIVEKMKNKLSACLKRKGLSGRVHSES